MEETAEARRAYSKHKAWLTLGSWLTAHEQSSKSGPRRRVSFAFNDTIAKVSARIERDIGRHRETQGPCRRAPPSPHPPPSPSLSQKPDESEGCSPVGWVEGINGVFREMGPASSQGRIFQGTPLSPPRFQATLLGSATI